MSGSEYNHTQQIFVNSYPWLFPGGVGDIYDMEQGEVPIIEQGQPIPWQSFIWLIFVQYNPASHG